MNQHYRYAFVFLLSIALQLLVPRGTGTGTGAGAGVVMCFQPPALRRIPPTLNINQNSLGGLVLWQDSSSTNGEQAEGGMFPHSAPDTVHETTRRDHFNGEYIPDKATAASASASASPIASPSASEEHHIPDKLNKEIAKVVETHHHFLEKLDDVPGSQHPLPVTTRAKHLIPEQSPPLTYEKFLTMQEKRVVVTIRYSGGAGLKPYFLTVAKKLKQSHPDVLLERRILPSVENGDTAEATFEVLVDGRVVVGSGRSSKQKVGHVDMAHARSVFVSMQELDVAISRSRRKRRPSATVYGDAQRNADKARLEMLRKKKEAETGND